MRRLLILVLAGCLWALLPASAAAQCAISGERHDIDRLRAFRGGRRVSRH